MPLPGWIDFSDFSDRIMQLAPTLPKSMSRKLDQRYLSAESPAHYD
jgi:hypothetical protein